MKLENIRVLDLSQFLPGPHLTMTMADHGADVIMVEPKNGVGEPVRAMGTRDNEGTAVWFRNIARGKRSIALDLKNKDDLATFLALADGADVIVEAFRPGVVGRLGIGYDTVAGRNPRIVYCSLSAFGQNGPWALKPSHDLGVQALAGTLDLSRGFADNRPNMPNLVAADMASSLTALSAILMALLARERTGKGDYIDIAMFDALIAWTPNISGAVLGEGKAPQPLAMRNYGGQAMNRIYETADGKFIVLAGNERKFCENLLGVLGRPDFLDLAAGEPGASQAPLIEFFAATFKSRPLAAWEAFLAPLDLCWAPVRTLKDGLTGENAIARGIALHDADGHPHIGPAIKFTNEPARPVFDLPAYEPGKTIGWKSP